ncbi:MULTISPECIES: outer membrane lipoprotein chaperone LolA [Aliivibrio]|uniref:Outer-membrane lipoprotein carrier protein n=1 Tax=Aliivibrio finisterrensis TaxID=511998 RepID=A0A4Q5KRD2_9GAMM|nr:MULTISPECIES: outer membrane lipoprotein chaperone LolA [Aliivibrio]MDD9180551.1 outer membrane lipoprotein chaperone LolA [Aliivibrio sp. A6]RYU48235.1 outer membrane lipoprotein chaperone LolA [Aliivibrio finisterrensis]RYU49042.1 outer membrane lipoprotein chaperone LolA [Aliivibrio finisterrensis]RYU54219.1 outer membrane lipoprotein chaperone LolA [Aliivibrio finisterrensis]RYU60252.1 outer membrane lipoprotein chaperone LolA [Aliivibrio finisterrensis]
MKKFLVSLCLLSSSVFSAAVLASPQSELTERLNQNAGFEAVFTQKVVSPEGDVLMQGEGDVKILRPNLFRWHTQTPDENLLVTDGETLWYYNPFVEQVTLMGLEKATTQTPFVLLTRNKSSDWGNYSVTQNGDAFTVSPKSDSAVKSDFIVNIQPSGNVTGFSVVEQDGQRSDFSFTKFEAKKPAQSNFTFTVPEGVDIDDQR